MSTIPSSAERPGAILPATVEEACRQVQHTLGATSFYFPNIALPLAATLSTCLSASRQTGDAPAASCECGRGWWAIDLPRLSPPLSRILFCGVRPDAPAELLDLCRTTLTLATENVELSNRVAATHRTWNQLAGETDLGRLAQQVFEKLGEVVSLRDAALLVEDDDNWLIPVASYQVRWSALQAAGLRLPTRRFYEDLTVADGLYTPRAHNPIAEWWIDLHRARHDAGRARLSDCRLLGFIYQHRLIGMLVFTVAPGAPEPDPGAVAILQRSVTAGLQNALLFASMEKFTTAVSTVHTIHRLMQRTDSPEALVQSIAKLACEMLQVRKCAIMLRDDRGTQLLPVGCVSLESGECGTFPVMAGWIWVNNESLVIENLAEDGRFQDEPAMRYREPYYLGVPLRDDTFMGVILVSGKDRPFRPADRDLLVVLAEQAAIALTNARLIEKQRLMIRRTLERFAELLEGPEPALEGLTREITDWALRLHEAVGADDVEREHLIYACLLREVGRLRPIEMEGNLSREERVARDRAHPEVSQPVIREMGLPDEVARFVLHHHEHWDGTGFPRGLSGDAIPLGARILMVAEAFVVLCHGRPGRAPMEPARTLRLMQRQAGRMYDPHLVETLARLATA